MYSFLKLVDEANYFATTLNKKESRLFFKGNRIAF